MATSPLDLKRSARWSMPTPPVLQGPGPGFGWGKKPPTGGAGRPNLGGKYHHAVGVFSVQMASKKGGRRAPPCSWTNARMGGSPVEPILVQGMTCAWCVGEGGAPHKSRPKVVPPAKGGLSRARGPRGVVHRGATTCTLPSTVKNSSTSAGTVTCHTSHSHTDHKVGCVLVEI